MTFLKNLTAAIVLAVLTTGATAADPPKAFEVGKGYSLEKGFSLTPDAVPMAPAPTKKPDCDCGPGCKCPPGACPSCEVAKKSAKSDCPECDALKNKDPLWFACRVVLDNGDGTGSAGSGTPISCENGKTVIVTNAHVVPKHKKNQPITVHVSGRKFPATYRDGSEVTYYTDPETGKPMVKVHGDDLAFLEIDAELGYVELADEAPKIGEQVWQFGYGGAQMNEGPIVKFGTVLPSNHVEPTMVNTIHSVSGDSGSGVFNTRGELVGVTWGSNETKLTACAVPLESVRKFSGRPLLSKLFPRLSERAAAKREARAAAKAPPALSKPPEVPRQGKIDPKLAAPGKDAPKPKADPPKAVPQAPFGSGIPPAPPGEGWQWDAQRRVWWKFSTPPVQGGVQGEAGSCPNGKCPSAVAPPSGRYRRW